MLPSVKGESPWHLDQQFLGQQFRPRSPQRQKALYPDVSLCKMETKIDSQSSDLYSVSDCSFFLISPRPESLVSLSGDEMQSTAYGTSHGSRSFFPTMGKSILHARTFCTSVTLCDFCVCPVHLTLTGNRTPTIKCTVLNGSLRSSREETKERSPGLVTDQRSGEYPQTQRRD